MHRQLFRNLLIRQVVEQLKAGPRATVDDDRSLAAILGLTPGYSMPLHCSSGGWIVKVGYQRREITITWHSASFSRESPELVQ